MRSLVFVLLVACGSKQEPAPQPAQPAPAPGSAQPAVMTKEECEARGARVNASIGGGGSQIHCTDDELDLGPVRIGIEGGWCCQLKK